MNEPTPSREQHRSPRGGDAPESAPEADGQPSAAGEEEPDDTSDGKPAGRTGDGYVPL